MAPNCLRSFWGGCHLYKTFMTFLNVLANKPSIDKGCQNNSEKELLFLKNRNRSTVNTMGLKDKRPSCAYKVYPKHTFDGKKR